jgi:hypothetical protein
VHGGRNYAPPPAPATGGLSGTGHVGWRPAFPQVLGVRGIAGIRPAFRAAEAAYQEQQMNRNIRQWLGRSLIMSAAALAACTGEGSLTPDQDFAAAAAARPELGSCDSLQAPQGNRVSARLFAVGYQVYSWSGTAWTFVAPSATLFASRNATGEIGIHYAGPTWESASGSKVVGTVLKRCTPDATAVPWLLLAAASSDGPGMFRGTTYIQRIKTTGGLAPVQAGSVVGDVANVPYTTEYVFYQAR